ncbi:15960_t:CDS:2, partial [Funneliformis caledonium]
LQNENNIKFGIIIALMFLDPTYDQVKIVSSKVQKRMDKWDSNLILQGKEPLENNNDMTNYVNSNNKHDTHFSDNQEINLNNAENEDYNSKNGMEDYLKKINAENTDGDGDSEIIRFKCN